MARNRERDRSRGMMSKKQTASANELLKYANKNNTMPFDWSKLNK
ncbi:hypothetical protein BN1058_00633 [Paraliobacillus sp. PM-2]|nr:hypothetical protein [Paraliobacillus sp. PM-2]CQR46375.1 hypothetical protein BN1058_00633 [Paraliobacillus sp. PM-2]